MREATQVASSAALSGSHHKAPGFAGGYLLLFWIFTPVHLRCFPCVGYSAGRRRSPNEAVATMAVGLALLSFLPSGRSTRAAIAA